jgi:hypothetical protein
MKTIDNMKQQLITSLTQTRANIYVLKEREQVLLQQLNALESAEKPCDMEFIEAVDKAALENKGSEDVGA